MNKKGFTLIELLAVVVVLGVIALITTPIVMNVIKEAQEGAAERSAENYASALNLAIARSKLNHVEVNDGSYKITENGNLCLGVLYNNGNTCSGEMLTVEVSGEKPKSGTVVIADFNVKKLLNLGYSNGYFYNNYNMKFTSTKREEADKWDGATITALSNVEYDATTKTYKINSAADLASIRDAINAKTITGEYTISLQTNIDLNNKNWIPIAYEASEQDSWSGYTTYFTGTFEGNGYTISGINVKVTTTTDYAGFFGALAGNARINNLNIEGSVVSAGTTAGGLVGFVYDENANNIVRIDNCNVLVSVESKDSVGGIIGRTYSYATTYITNSIKDRATTAKNIKFMTGKVGGFVGINKYGVLIIQNGVNNGDVSGGYYIGGFLGYLDSNSSVNINSCTNNGNVTAYETDDHSTNAGGIVGIMAEGTMNYPAGAIKNSVNYGTIKSNHNSGGIVANSFNISIVNNTNVGEIISVRHPDEYQRFALAGGIVGQARLIVNVESCNNYGKISGEDAAGGVIGRVGMDLDDKLTNKSNRRVIVINNIGGTELITSKNGTPGRIIGTLDIPAAIKNNVPVNLTGSVKNPTDTINAIGSEIHN